MNALTRSSEMDGEETLDVLTVFIDHWLAKVEDAHLTFLFLTTIKKYSLTLKWSSFWNVPSFCKPILIYQKRKIISIHKLS